MFLTEDMKSGVLLCLPKLWLPTESWQELPLCQQDQIAVNKTDTDHHAHFSAPDFAHNRDCCYQKPRRNEDMFFQSYCTTLEDTAQSYQCSSVQHTTEWSELSALAAGFAWAIFPYGTSSANSVLYLLHNLTKVLFSQYSTFQALKKDQTGSWTLISTTMICIFVTTYFKQKKASFCSLWEISPLSERLNMKISSEMLQISISQRKKKVIRLAAPKQFSLTFHNYWKITTNWGDLRYPTGDEQLKITFK